MGVAADTFSGTFLRRAGAAAPQRGVDFQARAVVALTTAFVDRMARDCGAVRGMARQMVMCALLLEQEDGQGLEVNLDRAVRVYREAGLTTLAALKKHASEARAILRYGVVGEGGSVIAALGEGGRTLEEIDEMLQGIKTRETFERRAQDLSGQRGGRPSTAAFRVLSAVAKLKAHAGGGDPKAEAELRLVRTFLLDE